MKIRKIDAKRDKLVNFNLNNRRLGRLEVHAIKKKKSCKDEANPGKIDIYVICGQTLQKI